MPRAIIFTKSTDKLFSLETSAWSEDVQVTVPLLQLDFERSEVFTLLRDYADKEKESTFSKLAIFRRKMEQGLLPFLLKPVDDIGTPYILADRQGSEIGMVGLLK